MSGTIPSGVLDNRNVATAQAAKAEQTMLLHTGGVEISKRVRRTQVRASRITAIQDKTLTADLNHEHVVVEHVAVGRIVEAIPPVRREGDVTIMPVVEEEIVMVRRLILREEIHLRRVRSTTTHTETVAVRRQHVAVTRTALDD